MSSDKIADDVHHVMVGHQCKSQKEYVDNKQRLSLDEYTGLVGIKHGIENHDLQGFH
jgi:hypothetical protein